jgi:hypothetical protein
MKKRVIALSITVIMFISIFIMNNTKVNASKLYKGDVSYSTSTNTVLLGNGFYSSSASLTPSPSTVDIGVDPATIQKVVIEDANGVQIAPLTLNTGSVYNLPSLTGQAISVSVGNQQSYNGYFRWLRNAQSNVWSYESDDGVTYHSTDAAPPNDSYGYYSIPSQSYVWSNYHVITHPSEFAVSGGIIPFEAVTNVTLTNAGFVQGSEPSSKLQLETANNPSFVNGYDAKIAFTERFDYAPASSMQGHYTDPTAIWYQYNNGVKVNYNATTYYYSSNWKIYAYVNVPAPTPTPTPPIVITGDFTVNPSAIKFRDSFTLHPLPFSIPAGCTYQYHQYRFSASGYSWDSPLVTSRTADSVFSYANYPTNLAVGSNTIYINVVADCASTNFITSHNLDVSAPLNDRPPVFDIGWFHQGDTQGYVPIYQAVLNDYLNLRVIHDNTVTPKTPHDPDGDSIYYTWQFDACNSTWVKGLPSNY